MKQIQALLAIMLPLTVLSQNLCGTDYLVEQDIHKHPEKQAVYEANWDQIGFDRSTPEATYVIPTVVHVIHDNGVGNISYEQVEDALRILNEDFKRLNPDTSNTRSIFKPHAAGIDLEFRLAQIDPNGNCTDGIVRVDNGSYSNDANNAVKSLSFWNSSEYFNIWVVNTIENFSGGNGIILGYAQFPGSGSWNTYGIVIRNDRMGTIGTAAINGDRTLTHEVGHCFNLLHVFQSGCGNNCSTSGDRVCDTPPMAQATYGCSQGQNTCSNDANGPSPYNNNIVDQIENYMSYDACQNMFTQGQVSRVSAALNNYSQLRNLWSNGNLVATGVNNMYSILCEADFTIDNQVICAGQSINLTDISYHQPDSVVWTLPGSTTPQVTGDQVNITYTTAGNFPVTATVYKNGSTLTETKQSLITVLPPTGNVTPFAESFESGNDIVTQGWYPDANIGSNGWSISGSAIDGNQSIKLNTDGSNFTSTLYSSSYDLRTLTNPTFTFNYAHARRSNSNVDILRVYASKDCGETWNQIWIGIATGLSTSPNTNANWTPNANEWEEVTVNLNNVIAGNPSVRFKFEMQSDGGNNLYLDKINIDGNENPIPALIYPYDNSTIQTLGPDLTWAPLTQANSYTVELDTSNQFNSSLYQSQNVQVNNQGIVPNTANFGLLNNTYTYYWRARSISNGSPSTWSPIWSFNISDTATAPGPNSIGEIETNEAVKVYPNPSTGLINISTPNGVGLVTVYNLSGMLVEQHNGNGVQSLQTELNQNPGVYIIQVTDRNGMTSTARVVLQQ